MTSTLRIRVTVTVDTDKAEGDEFELAVAHVHDAFQDFRLDAVTGVEIHARDDLRVLPDGPPLWQSDWMK